MEIFFNNVTVFSITGQLICAFNFNLLSWSSSGKTKSPEFKVLLLLLTLSCLSATRGQGRGSICLVPNPVNLILADGLKGDNVMDKYLWHLECLDLAQLTGTWVGGTAQKLSVQRVSLKGSEKPLKRKG